MSGAAEPADPEGWRVMVYDRTCRGRRGLPGLSHVWGTGARVFSAVGRFDHVCGVDSWDEGLAFVAGLPADRPIAEVQYWGHGKWGGAKVGGDFFGRAALHPKHRLHGQLRAVRERMCPGRGLFWFRTCETFGAKAGQAFAGELADFLGCRVAGHTFIIGHVQSGLHSLDPGAEPHWPDDEGIREGTPDDPTAAYWSRLWRPNTITFLRDRIPSGY